MIRIIALLCLALLTGCNKDSHEQVTIEYLDTMGQFVETCDSISDVSSAKASKQKIGELLGQLKELKARSSELGDADKKIRTTIKNRYETQFESLSENFSDSVAKIEKNPEVVAELESELKTLANLVNARPIRLKKR